MTKSPRNPTRRRLTVSEAKMLRGLNGGGGNRTHDLRIKSRKQTNDIGRHPKTLIVKSLPLERELSRSVALFRPLAPEMSRDAKRHRLTPFPVKQVAA